MRLDRFLTRHTPYGRRDIRSVLASGRVRVDGVIEKNGQREINQFSQIMLDTHALQDTPAVYLMLNKPAGYLSATKDSEHPTVMELINSPVTLHIAGRLDRATTGLLLLTNDGQWSRALTDPAFKDPTADSIYLGVPKVYMVETEHPISDEAISQFEKGIYFAYEDITTQPAQLEILSPHQCALTIYEGKYHQIKRMFHAIGNRVTSLHRTRVGNISLDSHLQAGEFRPLTKKEIII